MVIIGAGFAGLAVVRVLAGSQTRVTLVDRNIYSTFQPLLYQVATGGLNPGDVAFPLRAVTRRHQARFRRGTVDGVDTEQRRVFFADGSTLDYDFLVVAVGVTVNHFGIPGAGEYSRTIYSRGQAIAVRDELMASLERFATSDQHGELTIVVVGAGPTGVELAGTLAELRNSGLPTFYPEIDRHRVRVVLVDQASEPLPPFSAPLRSYAARQLRDRGVELRLGGPIRSVQPGAVTLGDGTVLASDLTIWAAGVTVASAVARWGLPQGHAGRIMVDGDLRVRGQERVFAAGDIALIEQQPLPQLAQPAIQMGAHIGRQIRRLTTGRQSEPFHYHDLGTMATIGRRSAVVQLPGGAHVTGTAAWLAWLGLHIVRLLGNRNRISALLNLAWRYVAWPGGSGVIVGDTAD